MEVPGPSLLGFREWLDSLRPMPLGRRRYPNRVPVTSLARQQQSLTDTALDLSMLRPAASQENATSAETFLYLGYGSNLSAETFLGKRGIRPLSQVNVVVPSLSLSFDLPGVPYSEPCFANSRLRDPSGAALFFDDLHDQDYHKDRWHKGLVGVVYEVTREDYAHIIATEGGGSGYQDVVVECFALSGDPTEDVPWTPSGHYFKAHTLFAPSSGERRPDQSYAQPSPRYLKLITDGAVEHDLPLEYQSFLHQIRTYHLTTVKQQLGSYIFLSVWAPLFLFFLGSAPLFARPDGTYPKWLATFLRAMFTAVWASYDGFFKPTFGDGERTIGDTEEDDDDDDCFKRGIDEKVPLIEQVPQPKYGSVTVVEVMV
ncbi:hypothetical protein EDD36DRAFT_225652 [Exophiala viscosa]|uniref:gamma-glutamylcyclotransferase n=1 Tax=Exophiala viscosa TaxID=2486360 RepID=A0AAN6IEF7_9EURO|nr:hypothetical protein EDD36DRAFT_225652 [Exophiala viscosa]